MAWANACYGIPVNANGSIAFNNSGGTITYTGGGGVNTATTVSIPVPNGTGLACTVCEQISGINATYQGIQNDFAPGGHTPEAIGDDIRFEGGGTPYTFDMSFATLPTFQFSFQYIPSW